MTRKPLKLLHTSDLHLGSDIYPADALVGFRQVIALSIEHSVDGVIVAGDLFDNRGVSPELVADVFRQFGELNRPVVVLPGNHDTFLMNGSFDRTSLPDGVDVMLVRGGESIDIEQIGLSVWGDPVYDHSPAFRPMGALEPRSTGNWYVGIAHGLVTDSDPYNEYSSKITPDELEQADCDYLALGHVHVFREVTSGRGAPAYYSGAPSGGRSPTLAIVSLDPVEGVSVEQIRLER
ncbi:MAG: DNA repair exonuclease [Chloroflexi bacterium]|nr:DNA repair exonuclease [Chloroflexota bacterium]MBT5319195.1 DNA repair exonuclease [Chloroflexota bacterium]MBT6682804.1 DNA repair exonuclease [Chloroflexota bacterium]